MAHFSNGTEFMFWEEGQCWDCVHNQQEEPCAVTNLHFCYQDDVDDEILDLLIPRTDTGNGVCQMFYEDPDAKRPETPTEIRVIQAAQEPSVADIEPLRRGDV